MKSKLRSAVLDLYESTPVQQAVRWGLTATRRDRRLIERYLRDHPVRKLQIGAGVNTPAGWLHTNFYPIEPFRSDIIFMDATRPFPFGDEQFDYIYSEHMIEHVPYLGGLFMLKECFRVLKPGGRLRILTPDFAFLLRLLAPDAGRLEKDYVTWAGEIFLPEGQPITPIGVVNNFVRDWGHVFIYDRATLEDSLAKARFVAITPKGLHETDCAALENMAFVGRQPDGFLELESMVYEAMKPD